MFGPCPVVRVKHDNEDGFVEINESDFDAEKHQLFDEARDDKEPKKRRGRPAKEAQE